MRNGEKLGQTRECCKYTPMQGSKNIPDHESMQRGCNPCDHFKSTTATTPIPRLITVLSSRGVPDCTLCGILEPHSGHCRDCFTMLKMGSLYKGTILYHG